MVAKDYTPSDDDLRFLSEHLCYEVEMTYSLATWMARGYGKADALAANAVLEAFTIHLRQLIDFFWPGKQRYLGPPPDALAADYFEAGEWDRIRPERPDVLSKAIRRKVGWGVVHLTYGRAWAKPEDKQWPFVELAQALAPAILAFLDHLEQGKLEPEHVERMKVQAEAWRDLPGAMQYLSPHT
jgi:hypothetical protein